MSTTHSSRGATVVVGAEGGDPRGGVRVTSMAGGSAGLAPGKTGISLGALRGCGVPAPLIGSSRRLMVPGLRRRIALTLGPAPFAAAGGADATGGGAEAVGG